jgi:Biotin-requiring enzyme
MASEVTIPRLGWNMDEGIFVGWLKADGEPIKAGEPLFNLEGDKATQEIESLEAGILRIPPAPKTVRRSRSASSSATWSPRASQPRSSHEAKPLRSLRQCSERSPKTGISPSHRAPGAQPESSVSTQPA